MHVDDLIIARALHILGVVLWIGGVAMETTVLLPAMRHEAEPHMGSHPIIHPTDSQTRQLLLYWRAMDVAARNDLLTDARRRYDTGGVPSQSRTSFLIRYWQSPIWSPQISAQKVQITSSVAGI